MSLVDAFMTECVMLSKSSTDDGEGGKGTAWQEGDSFDAAIVKDSSPEARVAESERLKASYTVTVARDVSLGFHDVFRRVSDRQAFRVTSRISDMKTPTVATFSFGQVSAEEWELTQ